MVKLESKPSVKTLLVTPVYCEPPPVKTLPVPRFITGLPVKKVIPRSLKNPPAKRLLCFILLAVLIIIKLKYSKQKFLKSFAFSGKLWLEPF